MLWTEGALASPGKLWDAPVEPGPACQVLGSLLWRVGTMLATLPLAELGLV